MESRAPVGVVYVIDSKRLFSLSPYCWRGRCEGSKVWEMTDLQKRCIETQAKIVMQGVNKVWVTGNI